MRQHAVFLSIDDTKRVKIGEPDLPVTSAERGRQVVVPVGSRLLAADHDFTKFSIIPSVILQTEIPEEFSGSWYNGQVMVMLKEGAFEPSSPARHSAEMATIIEQKVPNHPVLFIYSDGGPDHRLTYLSVKLALIALYLKLNLDYLCAARTAPYHSYMNECKKRYPRCPRISFALLQGEALLFQHLKVWMPRVCNMFYSYSTCI